MSFFGQLNRVNLGSSLRPLARSEASQLLEFAVALPLLVVFVVGIFDFGNAFNLKQKLNTAAREGARVGASLPTNDLSALGTPASINSLRDLVHGYLQAARVNDCGLGTQTPAMSPTVPLMWTYSAPGNGCPGSGLTLTIERGYVYPAVISGERVYVISTRVTLVYPYQWRFNSVIQLLVPGASYAGTTQISTDAVVPNID